MFLPISKNSFEKILKPISRLTDSCVLRLEHNKVFSLCSSQDQTVILYANLNLESDLNLTPTKLNIISISKLLTGLDCLSEEGEFFLELKTNHFLCGIKEIDGSKNHFKYHLVDDKVVTEAPVNINKITGLKFNTSFDLKQNTIKKILSGYAFTANPNSKLYIRSENSKVFATIDDKTQCNLDNVDICISDTLEGEPIPDDIILNMEVFKNISQSRYDVKVKINNQYKVLTFTSSEDKQTTLKYIISALVK